MAHLVRPGLSAKELGAELCRDPSRIRRLYGGYAMNGDLRAEERLAGSIAPIARYLFLNLSSDFELAL
jgi:hypothetical protein